MCLRLELQELAAQGAEVECEGAGWGSAGGESGGKVVVVCLGVAGEGGGGCAGVFFCPASLWGGSEGASPRSGFCCQVVLTSIPLR